MTSVTTDLTHTTEGCRYCWMCRQACPVGHVTRRETLTPHGWGMLIASERRGVVSWTPDVVDAMYGCADCGLCQAHCATGQPLPDAIAAARALIVASGQAPQAVVALHEGLLKGSAEAGVAGRRSDAPASSETALFLGEGAIAGDDTVSAVVRLLDAIGLRPALVAEGRPNGHLASSLGYPDTAAGQARAVVADVEASRCREVLVLAPADRFAFERLYGERLGVPWPEGVVVREVSTVLAEALAAGRLRLEASDDPRPWAYHDPCHSARIARDHAAPRALARAVLANAPECRMFWREQRAHPCGATGGLDVVQPAIAARLAAARFADAARAGARLLVTEDPACLRHLRASAPEDGVVTSLYEVLAAAVTVREPVPRSKR